MSHIIEQERHGFWIAAAFVIGLLGLILAFSALWRVNVVLVGSEAQIMILNSKIEALKKSVGPAAPATVAAAPRK